MNVKEHSADQETRRQDERAQMLIAVCFQLGTETGRVGVMLGVAATKISINPQAAKDDLGKIEQAFVGLAKQARKVAQEAKKYAESRIHVVG